MLPDFLLSLEIQWCLASFTGRCSHSHIRNLPWNGAHFFTKMAAKQNSWRSQLVVTCISPWNCKHIVKTLETTNLELPKEQLFLKNCTTQICIGNLSWHGGHTFTKKAAKQSSWRSQLVELVASSGIINRKTTNCGIVWYSLASNGPKMLNQNQINCLVVWHTDRVNQGSLCGCALLLNM